tara:strand:- start:1249 stop:2229 length:981 start_codon:yes stop_codon:yes gene_type:complete
MGQASKYVVKKNTTNKKVIRKTLGANSKSVSQPKQKKLSKSNVKPKVTPKTSPKQKIQKTLSTQENSIVEEKMETEDDGPIVESQDKQISRINDVVDNAENVANTKTIKIDKNLIKTGGRVNKRINNLKNNQIKINRISNKKQKDTIDHSDNEDDADEADNDAYNGDDNQVKPKQKVSKAIEEFAIKILKRIDPDRSMPKEDVVEILKEYKNKVNDLTIITACEYLLDELDNFEENLEKLEENRTVQEKKLKAKRLDNNVFKNEINLDLPKEDREPDENDRIFMSSKNLFMGSNMKYKKKDKKDENKFMKMIRPRKDLKKLKQFNI